jgi:3-dehydroquinate synthase
MPLEQQSHRNSDAFVTGEDDGALMGHSSSVGGAVRTYVQRFAVTYEYPVAFTRNLFAPANPLFAETLALREPDRCHKLVIFIDDGLRAHRPDLPAKITNYAKAYPHAMELAAVPEFVTGGEGCKNDPAVVERLQRRLIELGIDRHAFVVAIGGGALLDLVGYVSATVHRGIRHIRVPTTVLAQNDSGVGVKNGVNAFGQKNIIGTFAPPFAVLNDGSFLNELDERDKRAGFAEAVKVALIRDYAFFAWLERNALNLRAFRPEAVDYLIRRCAELHMAQIALGGDPFERGSARPLDFGHWSAHKIELLTGHALRHGEAVAIGIALDTRYSVLSGYLSGGEDVRVCNLLRALGLPLFQPMLKVVGANGQYELLSGLRDFREHLGGELTITLLGALGRGIEVHAMDEGLILEAIDWLEQIDR